MNDEWGPWIEHDGKGCPCVGQYVQVIFDDGVLLEGVAGFSGDNAEADGFDPLVGWKWALVDTENAFFVAAKIIRYCIRKPRALQQLRKLAQDVEKVREKS